MAEEMFYSGELVAPSGLKPVTRLLEGCSWLVELKVSGYDKTEYLSANADEIDLDMDSGQGPSYLFDGRVDGEIESARRLLKEFSDRLSAGKIVHRIELYREPSDAEAVGYFHFGWPQGEAIPPGPR